MNIKKIVKVLLIIFILSNSVNAYGQLFKKKKNNNYENQSLVIEKIRANAQLILTCQGPTPPFNNEISGNYSLDANGYILMPYIGSVKILGMTPSAAGRYLAGIYVNKGIFTKCDIAMTESWRVDSQATFFISGLINGAGTHPFKHGMTIEEAIVTAGGLSMYAGKNPIVIVTGKGNPIPRVKGKFKDNKNVMIRSDDKIEIKKKGLFSWGE